MDLLKKLLSDNSGVSMMRLMSLLSLLFGAVIAFISLGKGRDLGADSTAIGIFVGAAFGGKVWQKSIESKVVDNGK